MKESELFDGNGKKVLLVEGDSELRAATKRILEQLNLIVTEFDQGTDAYKIYAERLNEFGFVILGTGLGKFGREQLSEAMQKISNPVILLVEPEEEDRDLLLLSTRAKGLIHNPPNILGVSSVLSGVLGMKGG